MLFTQKQLAYSSLFLLLISVCDGLNAQPQTLTSQELPQCTSRRLIAEQDKTRFNSFMARIATEGGKFKALQADPKFQSDDHYASEVWKRMANNQRQFSLSAGESYDATQTPEIRDFFDTARYGFFRISELYLVGSALLEARYSSNLDLVTSLGATLITKEARALTVPVLSRAALEYRIRSWAPEAEESRLSLQRSMVSKLSRVYGACLSL